MVKLLEFALHLSSPQLVYYPGQVVAGYVLVNLNAPMEISGIGVKIQGKGSCHWSESEGTGDDRRSVDYYGKEKILKQKICLVGSTSSDSPRFTLPEGKSSYFFSFILPANLPSSIEDTYGHIRYELKGKIHKSWKYDHKVKQPFTVNDLIDPNLPLFSQGSGGEKHKDVGCLCCKAGPLDMTASIDRGAYCPGEAILISTSVANQTSRDMTRVYAKLIKLTIYHSSDGINKKRVHDVVSKLNGPPIPSGEYAKWENQPFGIPPIPPTIRNSKMLSVEYFLEVKVDVPWGLDPTIQLDLVIGTVPYVPTYGQSFNYGTPEDPMAPPEVNFSSGPTYAPPPPNIFGYPDMAPPSYSAVAGASEVNTSKGEKDAYTHGQLTYTPVYTFAQPYQGHLAPYSILQPDQQAAPSQAIGVTPAVPYPT